MHPPPNLVISKSRGWLDPPDYDFAVRGTCSFGIKDLHLPARLPSEPYLLYLSILLALFLP